MSAKRATVLVMAIILVSVIVSGILVGARIHRRNSETRFEETMVDAAAEIRVNGLIVEQILTEAGEIGRLAIDASGQDFNTEVGRFLESAENAEQIEQMQRLSYEFAEILDTLETPSRRLAAAHDALYEMFDVYTQMVELTQAPPDNWLMLTWETRDLANALSAAFERFAVELPIVLERIE